MPILRLCAVLRPWNLVLLYWLKWLLHKLQYVSIEMRCLRLHEIRQLCVMPRLQQAVRVGKWGNAGNTPFLVSYTIPLFLHIVQRGNRLAFCSLVVCSLDPRRTCERFPIASLVLDRSVCVGLRTRIGCPRHYVHWTRFRWAPSHRVGAPKLSLDCL